MIFSSQLPRRSAIVALSCTLLCFAQKDPGVRGGPPGAGGPIPGLTTNELALFYEGKLRMTQLEAVCDDLQRPAARRKHRPGSEPGNSHQFLRAGREIQWRPVLGLPPAAGHRRIGRLPGAESTRFAKPAPKARKSDVRPDSASQGRTELRAIVHHPVRSHPRSAVSKKAGRNAGRRRARTVHHRRAIRHRRDGVHRRGSSAHRFRNRVSERQPVVPHSDCRRSAWA